MTSSNISPYMMQILQLMQQGGGSSMGGSMAPQIPVAQMRGSNISQIPQQPQQQQRQQPTPTTGSFLQNGLAAQKLYNGFAGSPSPNPMPNPGNNINPNAMQGSPVANNAAGNNYLQQNPMMQSPNSGLPGSMNGPNSQFMNGGITQQPNMAVNANTNNSFLGAPTQASSSGMTGMPSGMGASGVDPSSMATTAGSTAADGTTAAATDAASDSSPSWLSQLWDFL